MKKPKKSTKNVTKRAPEKHTKTDAKHEGLPVVKTILVLVLIGIVGFTAWFIWHARQEASKNLAANSVVTNIPKNLGNGRSINSRLHTTQLDDPTAQWKLYSSVAGNFSLKYPATWATASHPELCTDGILLLGANAASVGTCASEGFGQMAITRQPGATCSDLDEDSWTIASKETVVVDSTTGSKVTATAKAQGEGLGSLPEGTKLVRYCFDASGAAYNAYYYQRPAYPDVLTDFELMVTSTLHFKA